MMFSGCELSDKNNEPLSDAELIQMIIDASKLEIDMDDLPEQSLEYINNDISYDEIASRVASGLGFEVELVGNGYRSGDRNEFYFNLEGRKLDPNDWGNKRAEGDRQDKEDWQCFDLIYPVTFEMPDGSTIIVETDDEEGWLEIKIWYDDNQETEERPSIHFLWSSFLMMNIIRLIVMKNYEKLMLNVVLKEGEAGKIEIKNKNVLLWSTLCLSLCLMAQRSR